MLSFPTASSSRFGLAPSHFAPSDAKDGVEMHSSEGSISLSTKPIGLAGPLTNPLEHKFSPYANNGGTSLGIAGSNFCVLATDTRLSEGYSILSRETSKSSQLTSGCVISTGGCFTDTLTLQRMLVFRAKMYEREHGHEMPVSAMAQMLSIMLYNRRFFPYYTFNIVGGLDEHGKGAVYSYDAVGSYDRVQVSAQGAGQPYIIPLLDNLIDRKNRCDPPTELTLEAAIDVVKEGFITAGERDIYVGDAVEIFIITKDGVRKEVFPLKKD